MEGEGGVKEVEMNGQGGIMPCSWARGLFEEGQTCHFHFFSHILKHTAETAIGL